MHMKFMAKIVKGERSMKVLSGFVSLLMVALSASVVFAEDAGGETAAIQKAIGSYQAAFNSRDASRLAAHWSPEGVYTSRRDGDQIVGRDALLKEFTALFAEEKETKLQLVTETIDFVSPNVAVERGSATVIRPNAEPTSSGYSVVFVRRDGKWLIDRVSEVESPAKAPSHYDHLKGLEWMIGNWVDQAEETTIKTTCKWTRNRNFIVRSFTASIEDDIHITGMQVVGWDAGRKQIRSWVFDSEGGIAEGVWKQSGNHWVVKTTATLANGKRASSTTLLRPLDENSFGWQKTNRIVASEVLPNIDEVRIVREKAK